MLLCRHRTLLTVVIAVSIGGYFGAQQTQAQNGGPDYSQYTKPYTESQPGGGGPDYSAYTKPYTESQGNFQVPSGSMNRSSRIIPRSSSFGSSGPPSLLPAYRGPNGGYGYMRPRRNEPASPFSGAAGPARENLEQASSLEAQGSEMDAARLYLSTADSMWNDPQQKQLALKVYAHVANAGYKRIQTMLNQKDRWGRPEFAFANEGANLLGPAAEKLAIADPSNPRWQNCRALVAKIKQDYQAELNRNEGERQKLYAYVRAHPEVLERDRQNYEDMMRRINDSSMMPPTRQEEHLSPRENAASHNDWDAVRRMDGGSYTVNDQAKYGSH